MKAVPIDFRKMRASADESLEMAAAFAVVTCSICEGLIPKGYPLWGVHLNAVLALHAAHLSMKALQDIPALTREDQLFGRHLELVP